MCNVHLLDPHRIPEDRFLFAQGIGPYITPELLADFHSVVEVESFGVFIRDRQITVDPDGNFAIPADYYEDWLESRP